ncbi:hypothetical protein GQF61_16815 [Sphingobacterium sp. DK4209]|uniref:Collagen-like protein n=1 Tax=Sphingobacterium zhuxiongii TaxID=2662364 RepID=A0A5Q0QB43_9SPHI|nr:MULTISPECIES: hypothetical protein [unclassified Sphingobacterium]MVZ67516.1 hypothetical protein [Sphingobacterium sp. DK4209]QGA24898.1 hypothetical protein GFH32_00530 [Sphingobacterium sp. dk4302]
MKPLKIIRKGIFILAMLTLVISCGKDGSVGPQGATGTPGIPGKDGALILNGNGNPASSLGKLGDMYLDKATSNLYGPKSTTGWGTPLNLRGSTGATGTSGATGSVGATGPAGIAGSRILSGSSNPVETSGVMGDYYLNRSSGDLFGPKTASGWGTAINLKGTANVIASTWVDYNWNNTNSITHKIMAYSIPTPILNAVGYPNLQLFYNAGGVLLVYGRNFGTSHNVLFDYSFRNARYSLAVAHSAIPNYQFFIAIESLNGATLQDTEYSSTRGNRFRFVLIPPGRQLSGTVPHHKIGKLDWSKKSYSEMKQILGIQE